MGDFSYWTGKHRSEETKRKISLAFKGRKLTEEHKQKISNSLKGHAGWSKGEKLSPSTRKKISRSLLGNKRRVGVEPWNKGLTKETDERVQRHVDEHLIGHPPTNHNGNRGSHPHQQAISVLASKLRGCGMEVEVEKPVKIDSRKWRVIDVLVNGKYCFEVGGCSPDKITELEQLNFEVIHLPNLAVAQELI